MLKIIGYINGTSKENMAKLVKAVSDAGFIIAYQSEYNASVIEEVETLEDTE